MKRGFKKGFTIIEVSLVLAIAGLIFLMVFVALPGLRASQRDSQRRDDMATLLEKIKNYQTNNRGTLPGAGSSETTVNGPGNSGADSTSWAGFYRDYLGDKFHDPDGETYRLSIKKCGGNCSDSLDDASFPNNYTILIVKEAQCDGVVARPTNNPRKIAVLYKLEGAGSYCSNS